MRKRKKARGAVQTGWIREGRGYDASYLARKHGLSTAQARALIARVGEDRAALNAAAKKLAGKRGDYR